MIVMVDKHGPDSAEQSHFFENAQRVVTSRHLWKAVKDWRGARWLLSVPNDGEPDESMITTVVVMQREPKGGIVNDETLLVGPGYTVYICNDDGKTIRRV